MGMHSQCRHCHQTIIYKDGLLSGIFYGHSAQLDADGRKTSALHADYKNIRNSMCL